jgi:regulator of cell morphogenesis and NO signaling
MLDPQATIASIVLDNSECAAVLDRFRIDYCCQGKQTLAQSCEARRVPLAEVTHELELAIARRAPVEIDPRTLGTLDLITRVIARHHQYLHRTLPFLRSLAAKVARVHGDREPQLLAVSILVDKLAEILLDHLEEEETSLFPDLLAEPVPPRVGAALARMEEEHEEVGTRLKELRDVAGGYAAPSWACNSYRTLMEELATLEADTLRHVHLENHVLLPRFVGRGD